MNYIITFLFAFIIHYALKQYRIYNNRKFEILLSRLKYKLRDQAINGFVSSDDWMFLYLDSSISKMKNNLSSLNIFHALYLYKTHKDDPQLIAFEDRLQLACKDSPEYSKIYSEYNELLNQYLIRRHFFLIGTVSGYIYAGLRSIKILQKLKRDLEVSTKSLLFLPETSTSDVFVKHLKIA